MINPVTRRDVVWGYMATALNVGGGLILLPVILRYLPSEDVGLWFVFITLASLAQLLEMGFQPTLARNAAYINAGAQNLNMVGLPTEMSSAGQINRVLLDSLVAAARRIYLTVAILAALVLLIAGTYYISTLLAPNQEPNNSLLAWLAFASGYIINFYYGYINGLLQGRGDVTQANKVVILSRSVFIIFGGSAVALGYGMVGLGLASMLAAISGRIAAHRYFHLNYTPSTQIDKSTDIKSRQAMIKMLWHNASRLGAVQVGAFLIQRGNILIASSYLGLATAASYGLTVTILLILSSISMVICQIQLPYITTLQSKGNKSDLISIYSEIAVASWAIYLTGLIAVCFFSDDIFDLIGSRTHLIEHPLLFVLGVVLLLELNHSIAATYLTTKNNIPFVKSALLSGLAILVATFHAVIPFGVTGLILSQGLIQAAYNNWKWPLMVAKDLEVSIISILQLGSKNIGAKIFRKVFIQQKEPDQ